MPYVAEDIKGTQWLTYQSSRSNNWDIYLRTYNGVYWSQEQEITGSPGHDLDPSIVQLANTSMALVWSSDRVLANNYSLYIKTYNSGVWSSDQRLTSTPDAGDSGPSLLQLRNGTFWVFFTRQTVSGSNVYRYVYYKSYNNGVWSPDTQFTTGGTEQQTSITQADNGTIFVVYSANRLGNLDVYYKSFNGKTWSAETALTTNGDDDKEGWIMQDFSGTLWVFWTRCISSGSTCQNDIFYKTSTNLGGTWSTEAQFTIDPTGYTIYDSHAAAAPGSDKEIYVYWETNLTNLGGDYDVYLSTSTPTTIHDLSITNAKAAPTWLRQGGQVKVNLTVTNLGDYNETARVYGYYGYGTLTNFSYMVVNLAPAASAGLQMTWKTLGVPAASSPSSSYRCIIYVQPATGESIRRQYDNTVNAGNVTLLPSYLPGDLDNNGRVNLYDAATLILAMNSHAGDPHWNPAADPNHDSKVNIYDLTIVGSAFGSTPGSPTWNPAADTNNDGRVNIADLTTVGGAFGAFAPSPNWNPNADVNRDGVVDVQDLNAVTLWYDTHF